MVALADVYDALTSERCYKKAYSHSKALEMIFEGRCGAFNPTLLQCLLEISDTLESELGQAALERNARHRRDTKGRIDYDNLLAREHSVSLAPPSSETLQTNSFGILTTSRPLSSSTLILSNTSTTVTGITREISSCAALPKRSHRACGKRTP